eukprot:6193682-Pleurochrysis_carterae.AAC.2
MEVAKRGATSTLLTYLTLVAYAHPLFCLPPHGDDLCARYAFSHFEAHVKYRGTPTTAPTAAGRHDPSFALGRGSDLER